MGPSCCAQLSALNALLMTQHLHRSSTGSCCTISATMCFGSSVMDSIVAEGMPCLSYRTSKGLFIRCLDTY